ncbi:YwdI family protein [Salinibacillus xinjiangensis]|uniref:YwdI family protein n=1 Tax=Salinibacillus xinjiangensis TaxID=1229268 RepID=A0A6G1X5S7_9BACI|nr:YwdI family protein [Salinibacillus xinjiangensis]MRG86256.1 hypothetical protein [Salinibacillus xinjiangensis]
MPVSDQKVLRKMMNEVQKAMENQHDATKMKEHIKSVRLLTDLFIDEESSTSETDVLAKLTEEKQMKTQAVQPQETRQMQQTGQQSIDHEGANGSSIFDF